MRNSVLIFIFLLTVANGRGQAHEQNNYPDFAGGWRRTVGPQWDPTKPVGLKQDAPLTPEYQRQYEANLREEASGGQAYNPGIRCVPGGMPRMMIGYDMLEFIIRPEITYLRIEHLTEFRRIYTDGRDWPAEIRPTLSGYSIGKWTDGDGDGRYDLLEIETRGFRGPRILDQSGIPLHNDNFTVVKERIFLNTDNVLQDEITTIDDAFTRPWTVLRTFRRERSPKWMDQTCAEANRYVVIGKETYALTADRILMPTRKDQPPPALSGFAPVPRETSPVE